MKVEKPRNLRGHWPSHERLKFATITINNKGNMCRTARIWKQLFRFLSRLKSYMKFATWN